MPTRPRSAGPAGSGLIPPSVAPRKEEPPAPPTDETPPADQPPAPEQPEVEQPVDVDPELIDGVPPVDDGHDDDGGGDDDGEGFIDPEEFAREIEDRIQRRFDKAITKLTRKLESQPSRDHDDPDGDDGDDGDGNPAPRRSIRRRSPQVDTSSMRILARDTVEDLLASAGRQEKAATKQILDRVIPAIDWSRVDDDVEFVEELVKTIADRSTELVKAGSDRKVAQLRRAGLIPQTPNGQPAGGPSGAGTRGTPSKMQAGASRAAARWPSGKRRLGAR